MALKEDRELGKAVDVVLRTEEGRRVFAYLFDRSGYNKIVSAIDPRNAEILPASSAYNDGRRSIYIDLRRHASVDLLHVVEAEAERPVPINQTPKEKLSLTTPGPAAPPVGTPPAGAPPAGGAPAAKELFSTVIPQEFHDRPYLKDFLTMEKTPEAYQALFKKLDGAESLIGKKTGIPAADAKPEEWDQFYARLRPENADAYELPLGKDADATFVKTLKDAFFEGGVRADQAKRIVGKIADAIQGQTAAQVEAAKKLDADFEALTKSTFGAENEKVLGVAKEMLAEFTPAALKPHADKLSNEALVILSGVLHAVHQKYGLEDKLHKDGNPPAPADLSALHEEGRKLMASPEYKNFQDPKNAETVARVKAIYEEIAKKK